MKVLPEKLQLSIKSINKDNIILSINENYNLKYNTTKISDNNILEDLLECNAYATTLLYLNENYKLDITNNNYLVNETNINEFYNDCEELLNQNVTIVEEIGIPLCDINGYKIFEGAGYILRGNGKKKIKENFIEEDDRLDLFPAIKEKVLKLKADGTSNSDIEEFIQGQVNAYSIDKEEANQLKQLLTEDGEGTQTTDIAPKTDQDMSKITTNKKKYYDVLLSDINESLNILNRGFLKNSEGQYQRGNYILVKEGEQYLAVHKNKLNGGNI